ncbi:hypothetical protein PoB_006545200 [Plakobranchus ocellatus]|uniref:Uncharacterized protein n=1 Tax=Plakobranchus ocellatus TaxID=259542 RepID=A0AAV4D448_9GAST|nr:hypothetical protein PoB_006545200 [Plakobranchus ocellatus]
MKACEQHSGDRTCTQSQDLWKFPARLFRPGQGKARRRGEYTGDLWSKIETPLKPPVMDDSIISRCLEELELERCASR